MSKLRSLLKIDLGISGLLITLAASIGGFCLLCLILVSDLSCRPRASAPPPPPEVPKRVLAEVKVEPVPYMDIVEKGDLRLEADLRPLQVDKHKLTFEDHEDSHVLTKIDGEPYYGTDGNVPRMEIAAVQLCWGDKPFQMAHNGFRDLFNSFPSHISADGDKLALTIEGGDGAGAFSAYFEFSRKTLEGNRTIVGVWDLQEEEVPKPSELPNRRVRLKPLRSDQNNPCSRRDAERRRNLPTQ